MPTETVRTAPTDDPRGAELDHFTKGGIILRGLLRIIERHGPASESEREACVEANAWVQADRERDRREGGAR